MRGRWTIALALLAVAGCQGRESEEEIETTNAVPVVVAVATTGSIRAVVRATGMVVPAPGADLSVMAPEAGRIAELPFAEGDRVRRGALLVRFEVPTLAADLESRRGDVARAEARSHAAHEAVTRLEGLFERGVAARKEVEEARREAAEAEADLRSANGAVAAALALADRTVVKAPFDGVVAARLHNPGDQVDASASDPVLRLVDPSRLQVEAAVPIADLAAIEVGATATVRGPGAKTAMTGSVAALPIAADRATGSARVRIALDGEAALPIDTAVEVEIATVEHEGATLVPAAAVIEEAGANYVYVVDAEQHAHRRAIEIGIESGEQVEVESGVDSGDQVIVQGHNALPDGAAVTPVTSGADQP